MSKKDKYDFLDDNAPKKNKKKKKRHGCLNCLITCLVLLVIFCGAIVGGGYWAWGKYAEPQVGLTFGEVFKVLCGLYKADEGKIVTNPYSQADLDTFYTDFKAKTYMQADTQLTIADILDSTVGKKSNNDESNGSSEPPTSTGNSALDGLLDKINFDFTPLANYKGEDNIMEITDKQFASILNEALTYFANKYATSGQNTVATVAEENVGEPLPKDDTTPAPSEGNNPTNNIEQYAKYMKYIDICQVTIDSPSAAKLEDVSMSLVLKISTRELVKELVGQSKVPAFLFNLLPKQTFAGMRVYPNSNNANAGIILNQIDKDLMTKVAGAIDKISGAETSIMQTINTTVNNVVTKLNEKLPISFIQSGCNIKPVQGMMNVLNISLGEAQFLAMIRDIKLPTAESMGVAGYTQELRTQAVQTFIGEFAGKYAFDNMGVDGNPIITPDNVFQQVGSMMQDENMLSRINLATLDYDSTAYNKDTHKVNMTYMALAGLLNSELKKPIISVQPDGTEVAKDPLPITILTMEYDQSTQMLGVVLSFDVGKLLGLDSQENTNQLFNKLVSQILPKEIIIKAQVPLANNGQNTIIKINNLNEQDSADLLQNITTLGTDLGINMSQFNIQELTDTLEKAVKDNLDKINKQIGAEIKFGADKCLLPSIFEVVAGLDMLKTDNVAVVTDEELHDMLRSAYTYTAGTPNKADNALALVGQIESKYYINEGVLNGSDGNALLNSIKAIKDNFQDDFDVPRMAADTTPLDQLKPIISQEELGFILQSSGKLDDIVSIIDKINIVSTNITTAEMKMQIEGEIALTGENAKYSVLLPKKIYLNLTVDTALLMRRVNGEDVVCTSFDIDGMNAEQMTNFFEVASKLGGQPLNQTEICNTLDTKIAAVLTELINGGNMELVFVEGGIKLDKTVFDIAADQIYTNPATTKPSASELRQVLQKVNIIPEEYKTNNLSQDLTAVVGEINTKYYLNTPLEKNNTIYDQISAISGNYLNIINGKTMNDEYDKKTLPELRPNISGGELGRIFSTQVAIGGAGKGLDNAEMTSLKVVSDTSMEIVFTAKIAVEETNKYKKLLPNAVSIVVDFDKSLTNDTTKPCTTFTINDMTTEDIKVFTGLVQAVDSTANLDIDELNKSASDQLKEKIKALSGESEITLSPADIDGNRVGGTITMSSIFGLALNKIYEGETTKPTEEVLRETLHALWTPVNVVGQSEFTVADEMKEGQIKITPLSLTPPIKGKVEIEVTDRNIGAILQNKENEGKGIAESLGITDTSAVTYKQALMFSPTYENRQAVIDALHGMTFQNNSYMMIGVNIKTSALITSSMLPDNIDVTALLDIDTAGYPFELMINNLNGDQKAIINKILTKNSGNASIFDETSKDNLKNNILNTEVCKISAVGGVSLPTPFIFSLRDLLGKIEKKDDHSVRHTRDTSTLIPEGTPFGGYIRVSDTVGV